MKRFRLWTFHLIAALSLLLMTATMGLWIDSYWNLTHLGKDSVGGVASMDGGLLFLFYNLGILPDAWFWVRQEVRSTDIALVEQILSDHGFLGFGYVGPTPPTPAGWRAIICIPFWFVALSFAILPTIWVIKLCKRRKFGPNCCAHCAYDLTGNTTGACPECGAVSYHEVSKTWIPAR